MRTIRFYLPVPLAPDTLVELGDDACHHARHVLRMKAGDPLVVFNGEGGDYEAVIANVGKKSITVRTGKSNSVDRESPLHTHLAIGLSKGDRFDVVLQKATELGVSRITPLVSGRTEVRLGNERQDKAMQRWQKIIANACEQCYRTRLPILDTPLGFNALLAQENSASKFILHPPQDDLQQTLLDQSNKPKSVCLLVGPEGGFTDAEVALAAQRGFAALALGPRILRTETAPLAALSILQFVWGDFPAHS